MTLIREFLNESRKNSSFIQTVPQFEHISEELKSIYETDKFPFNFEDDTWNFKLLVPNINKSAMILNFVCHNKQLNLMLKRFALKELTQKKVLTVSSSISTLKLTLSTIMNDEMKAIEQINFADILKYLENGSYSFDRKKRILVFLREFYSFLSLDLDLKIELNLETVNKYISQITTKIRSIPVKKTELIPDNLFSNLIKGLIKLLHNNNAPYKDRLIAGAIIIQTQTGLRTNEILSLSKAPINKVISNKYGKEIEYISYKQSKSIRKNISYRDDSSICTSLCKEAINCMNSILDEHKLDLDSNNYLLNLPGTEVPISGNQYTEHFKRILIKYFGYLFTKELEGTQLVNCQGISYYLPQPRQFRVFFATYLFNNGVALPVVEKLLGHISTLELEGYYIRTRTNEQILATQNVVTDLVSNKYNLLGGTKTDSIKTTILKLCSEHKIDPNEIKVQSNIDELFSLIQKQNLRIRSKAGGFCIRNSAKLTCPNDKITDKLLCVNGICPNAYHFFYNIYQSYSDFSNSYALYSNLIQKGLIRESECEFNKLKDICLRRLNPEMEELKREIARTGSENIILKHPELEGIINNLTSIEKEVKKWMTR